MTRLPVLALLAALALSGCAGGGEVDAGREALPAPAELPEGDPGQDAPEAVEPTGAPEEHEDAPALSAVPAEALLDPTTLAGVAGGAWTARASGAAGPCGALPATAASRSVRLTGDRGELLQTVLSYRHGDDGPAVQALAASFADCGWTPGEAPALGESAARADGPGGGRALVVAAEGAVVVLTGRGALAADDAAWDAVADVALGTACPAAPEGCH